MTLLQSKDGIQHFTFEHGRDYQQVQFKFLDAVESMDPNNIVVKNKNKKVHVCTLISISLIIMSYFKTGIISIDVARDA